MKLYRKGEGTYSAWGWRLLIGPAHILDGILYLVSLGFLHPELTLYVSKRLARARFKGFRLV